MATETSPDAARMERPIPAEDVRDRKETTCCIVGAGPGGMVLALLLARQGIPVILLESHKDFDRDFRGDLLQPAVMEILGDIGLGDRLLELPHIRMRSFTINTSQGPVQVGDPSRLKCRYPFITVLPQAQVLSFLADEARKYPNFELILRANVRRLIEEDGAIRGVQYEAADGWHEVRALLTVGADGRFSRIRQLAGLKFNRTCPPTDVLWFRLPRSPSDPQDEQSEFAGYAGQGRFLLLIGRVGEWQLGYSVPKGKYQELRAAGIQALRDAVAETVPWLVDRVDLLTGWDQISVLSVDSGRVEHWYRPGLLLIGDAAHVMSPIGAAGINYAVQDAAVASNVLGKKLKAGQLDVQDLAEVQRQRKWPTRFIQAFQAQAQKRLINSALQADKPFQLPLPARIMSRLPFFRNVMSRLFAFGPWKVRVRD